MSYLEPTAELIVHGKGFSGHCESVAIEFDLDIHLRGWGIASTVVTPKGSIALELEMPDGSKIGYSVPVSGITVKYERKGEIGTCGIQSVTLFMGDSGVDLDKSSVTVYC